MKASGGSRAGRILAVVERASARRHGRMARARKRRWHSRTGGPGACDHESVVGQTGLTASQRRRLSRGAKGHLGHDRRSSGSRRCQVIKVGTPEMEARSSQSPPITMLIMTPAAVADFRVAEIAEHKIKKGRRRVPELRLVPTQLSRRPRAAEGARPGARGLRRGNRRRAGKRPQETGPARTLT